jgi:hypothetical protein
VNYHIGIISHFAGMAYALIADDFTIGACKSRLSGLTIYSGKYRECNSCEVRKFDFDTGYLQSDYRRLDNIEGLPIFKVDDPIFIQSLPIQAFNGLKSSIDPELERITYLLFAKYRKTEAVAKNFYNAQLLLESGEWWPEQLQFELILEIFNQSNGRLSTLNPKPKYLSTKIADKKIYQGLIGKP